MLPRGSTINGLFIALLFGLAAAADDSKIPQEVAIDRTIQLRTHSAYAPYIDQDLQNRWWDFGADAYVNTNKHIRLTRARPGQVGWLWSRLPLSATNFVVEVEFKISGESSHLYGDGMAIWLTKGPSADRPCVRECRGLGIFLDTYANSRHAYSFPRVNVMLGDGKTSYDVGNDGDGQLLGGCSANYRRTNVATKVKITYLKDRYLDVKVHYKAWDDWKDCLRIKNVTLPSTPFLGFSAHTGDVFDAHDIISVTSSSAVLSIPKDPSKDRVSKSATLREVISPTNGSALTIFFKLIVFLGLCAGGFYAFKEYQRRKHYGGGFGGGFGGGGSSSGFGLGGTRIGNMRGGYAGGGGLYGGDVKRF